MAVPIGTLCSPLRVWTNRRPERECPPFGWPDRLQSGWLNDKIGLARCLVGGGASQIIKTRQKMKNSAIGYYYYFDMSQNESTTRTMRVRRSCCCCCESCRISSSLKMGMSQVKNAVIRYIFRSLDRRLSEHWLLLLLLNEKREQMPPSFSTGHIIEGSTMIVAPPWDKVSRIHKRLL